MNTVIIRTLSQVQQAQADAWVYGLIITGVALAIAIIIAFMINFRSDCRDYITRRICFIVIGLVFPVGYWLYNIQSVIPRIQNPGFKSMFEKTNLTVLIVAMLAYYVLGVFTMTISNRGSKWRNILPKKFQ